MMQENLLTIGYVILVAFSCGICTHFIMMLIGNPDHDELYLRSIFSFYGVWLMRNYDRVEKPIKAYMEERGGSAETGHEGIMTRQQQMHVARKLNKYKALGGCKYCFNVWATAIISGIIFFFTGPSLWWIFLCLPLSNLSLNWVSDRF